jgi:hypothetical protein
MSKKKKKMGFSSFDVKGIRESLADVIYNVSPKDTPFLLSGPGAPIKMGQSFFEWQQDKLDRETDPRWSAHDTDKLGEEWGLCAKCSLATKNKVGAVWQHVFCPSEASVVGFADVYTSDFGDASIIPNRVVRGNYSQISKKVVIVDKALLKGKK